MVQLCRLRDKCSSVSFKKSARDVAESVCCYIRTKWLKAVKIDHRTTEVWACLVNFGANVDGNKDPQEVIVESAYCMPSTISQDDVDAQGLVNSDSIG